VTITEVVMLVRGGVVLLLVEHIVFALGVLALVLTGALLLIHLFLDKNFTRCSCCCIWPSLSSS